MNHSTAPVAPWRAALAVAMRRFPLEIRRSRMIWWKLYQLIGGGSYHPSPDDQRWPRGLRRCRWRSGQIVELDLSDWSDRFAYFAGVYYQRDLEQLMRSLLRPGDQFLDIGANIGMTCLIAADCIGPTGKAVALEPKPAAYARLKRHVDLNGLRHFQLIQAAAGARDGQATLTVRDDHTGSGTLTAGGDDPEASDVVNVPIVRVDDRTPSLAPDRPTIVKMDVEGYELEAIRGMPLLLSRPEIACIVEVTDRLLRRTGGSAQELHRNLAAHGLQAHRIVPDQQRWHREMRLEPIDGPLEQPQYDCLFARPGSGIYHQRIAPMIG